MKTLFILRHAKSSWKNARIPDFERPLNGRGRRAAQAIGEFIAERNVKADLVLSSPAVRAAETIAIALESARLLVELQYDERLYLASCASLLGVVAELSDDRGQVFLVGHNPGLEALLHRLTGVLENLPTGALSKIDLDTDHWADVEKTSHGRIDWLITPREIGIV